MKKTAYYWISGLAFAIFVALGLLVKWAPEVLTKFDTTIQAHIRGHLPESLTHFFKAITIVGNTSTQVAILVIAVALLYLKKYHREAIFLAGNGILAALFIVSLKHIFQRPRPSISHLVHATGYSFPSGHSMGTMLILGSLIVISLTLLARLGHLFAGLLGLTILLVGLSRVYLGVHYPTDVIAGFSLGLAVLMLTTPYYLRKK